MKRLTTQITRLFAAGLMSAALTAPLSASAGLLSVINDIRAPRPVLTETQPSPQPPTVRVTSPKQLLLTLYDPTFSGRVIIPANAAWDLSGFVHIPLRSGVQLIGERGYLGSRPLLFTTSPSIDNQGYALFVVQGCDVRVEGIHFRGPAHTDSNRSSSQPRVKAIYVIQNKAAKPEEQSGLRVVVADCEFNEWTKSGVQVERGGQSAPLGPSDAGLVRVERNYFHHNATDNDGYGVGVSLGSYVTIEGNVFDYNRHAVGAEWYCGGYIARFNYVLQGGYRQDGTVGSYYNQHFDAHGQYDGYGGKAGEYFDISFNTIRGAQTYYITQTRPALMLRGTPDIGAHFNGNVLVHDNHDDAISFKGSDFAALVRAGKYEAIGNQYDTDCSRELATGDFDGDGLNDVFVANGTAWFVSRGGQRPWEFLHASTKRTHELAFADIDNDRVTDVIYRDPSGNLGYLKSGVRDLAPLTTVPRTVLITDLRFGDFDGDGKTDIFYTLGGQWHIWYGKSRTWTPTLGAALPASAMLFGEFDGVPGTDIVAALPDDWACSSGGTVGWVKLNARLRPSFANAVAADFDGNGKSDIAFNEGGTWRFSPDGVAPLVLLRDGADDGLDRNVPLKLLPIGRFDGGPRAQVVKFRRGLISLFSDDKRLYIWRGLASGSAFSPHSEHNMR